MYNSLLLTLCADTSEGIGTNALLKDTELNEVNWWCGKGARDASVRAPEKQKQQEIDRQIDDG